MIKDGSFSYDTTIQARDELGLFADGSIAMTLAWNSSNARNYASDADFRIFPMAFPTYGGSPELCSGIWGFGIFNK